MNAIADEINLALPIDQNPNFHRFKQITRRINGGLNGIQDRIQRYKSGLPYFLIEAVNETVSAKKYA